MAKFTVTANLNIQTPNLGAVVRNLQNQLQGVNVKVNIQGANLANNQLKNVSNNARNAAKSVGVLDKGMRQVLQKFAAFTIVTGGLLGIARAFKAAVKDAIEFEREIVKVAQATGKTVSQLRGLVGEINSVATTFGVSSEELVLASRSLAQAGFAANKVSGALKILAQTELAATFDSIQDTTEGAIALLNQFGKEAQRTGTEVDFLEKSFSAINEVSKKFAVESADLVTTVRATGAAFESAGGSLNELLALFTSVRSTTRESAESIATGFRTIFTRVQRVDTINALRNLGIELQDAEGKFVKPVEAVKRLSIALNTIDPRDFRFNLVVEELGGFRQVSKVIPLIQQFAVTQNALGVAQRSSGSLAKDAETAQQSLAVQIAKTKEEFFKFARTVVEEPMFKDLIRGALDLSKAILDIGNSIKGIIPAIGIFGSLKAGISLARGIKSLGGIRRARGGPVPGSGSGDIVPAMLEPGEFVINKKSAQALGYATLNRANKYSTGGKVNKNRVEVGDTSGKVFDGGSYSFSTPSQIYSTKSKSIVSGIPGGVSSSVSSGDLGNSAAASVQKFVQELNDADISTPMNLLKGSIDAAETSVTTLSSSMTKAASVSTSAMSGSKAYQSQSVNSGMSGSRGMGYRYYAIVGNKNRQTYNSINNFVGPPRPPAGGGGGTTPPTTGGGNTPTPNAPSPAVVNQFDDALRKNRLNAVALAATIATVTTHFSDLSEEQQRYYGALGASFSTVVAIGAGLKDLQEGISTKFLNRQQQKAQQQAVSGVGGAVPASGMSPGATLFNKVSVGFDALVLGFATSTALVSAKVAELDIQTQKYAESLNKTLEQLSKDPSKISGGRIGQDIGKTFKTSAESSGMQMVGGGLGGKLRTVLSVLAGTGYGATIGATRLGRVAGGYGALAGGVVGGIAGGYANYKEREAENAARIEAQTKDRDIAANSVGASFKTSADAVSKSQKFLLDVDKKSNTDIFSTAKETSDNYAKTIEQLNTAQMKTIQLYGSLEKAPKEWTDTINKAKDAAAEVAVEFNRLSGADLGRVIKEVDSKVGTRGFDITKDLAALVGPRSELIRKNAATGVRDTYGARITELNTASGLSGEAAAFSKFIGKNLQEKTGQLGVLEGNKQAAEFGKTLLEASIQSIKQKEALEQERMQREKLIGTLAEQTALQGGLENLEYSSKKASAEIARIGESFGSSISGLGKRPSSDVFNLTSPNAANSSDFQNALKIVSSIGPAGERMSKNFNDLNSALPKFQIALTKGNIRPGTGKGAVDDLISGLGIDKNGDVGRILAESIAESIAPSKITPREGVTPTEDIAKEIFKRAEDIANTLRESNKRVLDLMVQNENVAREAYDKINQSRQNRMTLELEGLDKRAALAKNIAGVRGTDLSLAEKNAFGSSRQSMLAGGLAGNATAIGGRIGDIKSELMTGRGTIESQAKLKYEFNNLSIALKELSDQSGKTADTMAEIDKFRNQREAVSGLAKDFAFGDKGARKDISRSIQATNLALATGDIDQVRDKDKAGVQALLKQFADSPVFNGLTGKQVENNLTANQFRKMGAFDIADMVQQGTSTPEEKLIGELRNISNVEQAARVQLAQQEMAAEMELTNVIKDNAQATRDLIANIPKDAAALAAQGGQDQRSDVGELAGQRKLAEDQLIMINKQIESFNGGITRLLSIIDGFNKSFNERSQPQNLFNRAGSAIGNVGRFAGNTAEALFRASGGSVFQPRGTDTVPAMLTPGEFVMRKEAVQRNGLGFMNRINSGGMNYMAGGGSVGGMSTIAAQFSDAVKSLNGIKITHQVTVDGQLNIGGINVPDVAERIKQAIGEYVGNLVAARMGNPAKGTSPNA